MRLLFEQAPGSVRPPSPPPNDLDRGRLSFAVLKDSLGRPTAGVYRLQEMMKFYPVLSPIAEESLWVAICIVFRPDRSAALPANSRSWPFSWSMTCHFVEMFVTKLVEAIRSGVEQVDDKSLENQMIVLCHMYNFMVIKGKMVIEIMDILKENVTARNLTLILLALSYAGASFKKRDSASLEQFIENLQIDLSRLTDLGNRGKRVKFFVEEILSIKYCNILNKPN
ncbi:hypothetical protein QR680_000682 [Steinernema hermaphroditum]|uniref:MIF4G domain-containing protein n=1 Tax=Steinernema hermaphroditum TaxID=289476 RepID=A0AA39LEL7_9BILA|nr:hypothetical protein QR680_000682 [Steinernema hermaphroditum]